EIGYAFIKLRRPDSAAASLDRLGGRVNALDLGTNDLYRADLLAGNGDYPGALRSLQKAIISFSPHFTDGDIHSNPSSFTGSFASYRLLDALYKKAVLLEQLYPR